MSFEQTVTIINNSGKIISTGKHLVGIFKEARSAYKEKKEALKQERASTFRRAQTFSAPRGSSHHGPFVEEYDDDPSYDEYDEQYLRNQRSLGFGHGPALLEDRRRLSLDDGDRRSYVSTSSRRRPGYQRSSTASDARSQSGRSERRSQRPPLTSNNLRTLTEVSATRPSAPPSAYRPNLNPYAETAPRDLVASRLTLDEPGPLQHRDWPGAAAAPHASMTVHRPRSDPAMRGHASGCASLSKSSRPIDMNLAYGDIPPDLALRSDLDPIAGGGGGGDDDDDKEAEAQTLVDRVETLLNEAHCIHHTAASIINHLQGNPEAAAAVALTLAELSAILTKMSPAFLGVVKGGSPAVFALLASPQFLIGTSIAVGVTVVLFGGWKIIKRISDVSAAREGGKLAIEMTAQASLPSPSPSPSPSPTQPQPQPQPQLQPGPDPARLPSNRPPTVVSNGYDEALVLEEELSTIECWRRGIVQPLDESSDEVESAWEGTVAEIELISPEAMRSRLALDDARTLRSVRTHRTAKSHSARSTHSTHSTHSAHSHHHTSKSKSTHEKESTVGVPKRSSRNDSHYDDSQSKSGGGQRSRGSHDRHSGPASEAGSVSTTRSSHHSGHSRRHRGSQAGSSSAPDSPSASTKKAHSDAGSTASKDKKSSGGGGGNMLKQLFKKKMEKGTKERDAA